MHYYLGIDPSFTATGVSIHDENFNYLFGTVLEEPGHTKDSHAAMDISCLSLVEQLDLFIATFSTPDSVFDVVIENPAPTNMWAAVGLNILHGHLMHYLTSHPLVRDILIIPCTACDKFTGNKQHKKKYLVDYAHEHGLTPQCVKSDDIVSAAIFVSIYRSILSKDKAYDGKYSFIRNSSNVDWVQTNKSLLFKQK